MSQKKSQHILAVQQVLADFDIETQVRKTTIEAMTAYMQGNKQAFEYIKEWENKFIQYQARLIKAENYYKNIQSNVNSKIQVTNTLNQRLQKFSQRFYTGIKQSEESLQHMRRNYLNMVRQIGTQAATQRTQQRVTQDLSIKIQKLQTLISLQTQKLTQKILQTDQQITLKNQERRSEAQNILLKLTTAKSQLDSKSDMLNQLLKDIELYKNEKLSINSQISHIYDELSDRVQLVDFSKIRLHVDSIQNTLVSKIDNIHEGLNARIYSQIDCRVSDKKQINARLQEVHVQLQEMLQKIQGKVNINNQILTKSISGLNNKITGKIQIIDSRIDENILSIQSAQKQQYQILKKIDEINNDLMVKNNHIIEAESNILSINSLLKQIQLDNNLKSQQLAKLKVDNAAKGDINDQLQKITEKLLSHDESIRKNTQKQISLISKIETNNLDVLAKIEDLTLRLTNNINTVDKRQKVEHKQLSQQVEKDRSQLNSKVQSNYCQILKLIQNSIKQNIGSIKDKFQFLNTVSKDVEIFKKTFEDQLQMNGELNKEIKQKMDRMFGMFTKLKTDAYLKIQTISLDQTKIGNKLKQNTKGVTDIWTYLSQINESITIALAVGMWREFVEDKDSGQEYKIASLLEGWVLQATKDRSKYRGEYSSKKALMQLCLQQHIKYGDKIKGSLIENGKQIFMRMSGGSEDYQLARRKSISRRKDREKQRQQSQLPKVYR